MPRSRGGPDDSWNLEEVSDYDHAFGHALDFVLFPEVSPMFDFRQPGWKLLPEDLQTECRKEVARRQRIKGKQMVGPRNGRYQKGLLLGVPKSEEHKAKIAQALKGNRNSLGVTHSEEFRLKQSQRQKGKETTCPHCGKVGHPVPMHRWHFNNCKQRT